METTIVRITKSFRLRSDLLEGLQRNAKRSNRSLNNYVESVLLDVLYHESHAVTKKQTSEEYSLKPYTMEEINARINQAERESAAGLGQDSEEMFRELEKEFAYNELETVEAI